MDYGQYYTSMGWKLCNIPAGQKGPQTPGWQLRENAIENPQFLSPGNIGLLHAYSGTCSIDVDDVPVATQWLGERGVNLIALATAPDAVQIDSGNPGHGKLIYRLAVPLLSKKIVIDGKNILDFRCGTAQGTTCQDVLPPSIHPNGNAYRWIGDPGKLPMLPDSLYQIWLNEIRTVQPVTQSTLINDMSDEQIVVLLNNIDPSCSRKDWIAIGMALHATGSPNAYTMFDRWSARSAKYRGERDTATQWRSFETILNGITPRTLYHRAIQGGWRPDLAQALELFKDNARDNNVVDALDELVNSYNYTPEIKPDYLPYRIQAYADEISRRVGCNHIVPVMAGLIAASAAADHRSRLWINDSYWVPPVLWSLIVATPGAKKTPGSKPMFAPLQNLEKEDVARYQKLLLLWEAQEAAHAASKKQYLKKAESDEYRYGNEALPEVTPLPDKPKSLRLMFGDSTSQKIIRMLDGRPQGLACVMDESGHWLRKMIDPKSGEDRGMWLVGYESNPYTYDRVGAGTIRLDNLSVSVFGNVQVDLIDQMVGQLQSDGFSQRFMPVYIPIATQSAASQDIDPWMSEAGGWELVIREIHGQGKRDYYLSPAAKVAFKQFENRVEELKVREALVGSPMGLQSSVSKFLGLLGRLSLVFHLIDDPGLSEVPVETVEKAQAFLEDFVYLNMTRFYGQNEGSFVKWLFDWLIVGNDQTVSEAAIRSAGRRQLEHLPTLQHQRDKVQHSMQILQSYGVVAELSPEVGSKSTIYAINPAIYEKYATHRDKVVKARKASEEERKTRVAALGKEVKRKWSVERPAKKKPGA